MAHMPGKVEDVTLPADKLSNKAKVAAVALNDFNVTLYRFDIEEVGTTGRVHRIEENDRSAGLNEANGEIASDEAETACD